MKRFLAALLCVIAAATSAFCFTGCEKKASVSVYMPDGAPALAMTMFMADFNKDIFEREVDYNVVEASTIQTYVTGENPKADVCIIPVNAASKLLGGGETYKMLGTITHGNLFILKKNGGVDINRDNVSSLKGKTVGVINLAAVPGLTFRLILNDYGIEYNLLGNGSDKDENKVNLKAVDATEVLPSSDCDYFVVPEPAATTKINATKGALSLGGSLQELYGDGNGYPQAVVVAKNSLISDSPDFIEKLMLRLAYEGNDVLLSLKLGKITADEIENTIKSRLSEGMSPKFTAANLSETVIKNCAIKFVKAADCKAEVNAFLNKIISVEPGSAKTVADEFYFS